MKINLDYPYNQDWKYGYLVVNSEGRQTLILFNSNKNRSSTAYARYLLAVKHGRYLTENEEADHIDTDHTKDNIDNLQILTITEHKEKTFNEQSGKTFITFICKCCNIEFNRDLSRINKNTKFCSKECNWKMNPPHGHNFIDYDKVLELINSGLSDIDIAREMGINKNSVLNYRKQNSIPSKKFEKRNLLEENIEEIKNLLLSGTKKLI